MTPRDKRILVIADPPADRDEVVQVLKKEQLTIQTAGSYLEAVDRIYSDPPDLVIVSRILGGEGWKSLCEHIKKDPVFGHLPVVLSGTPDPGDGPLNLQELPIDDYFEPAYTDEEIRSRVSLVFARAARVRDANPLTRLPGNYTITKEIQSRIDHGGHFEIAYLDLDHFKSYNDKYGFLRGDEIIKMTARLLTNAVRRRGGTEAFVGHVGGDDFVFIVPPDQMPGVCEEIIRHFDLVVGDFYDETDRLRGYIESTNRKGEAETFPFVSVSIAVVTNEHRPIEHIGEVSAIAAEVKKRAKAMPGSSYYKDKRRVDQ